MISRLRRDAAIRNHFQFWVFSYPNGYPYPYSAALLRRELDEISRAQGFHKPIVVIGHSMGSLIARLMITDSEDKFWRGVLGKHSRQLKLSPKTREILEESLIFRHRDEVGRVVFIAGPHRGSDLAAGWGGRLASRMVEAVTLLTVARHVGEELVADGMALDLGGIPNSVDALQPSNRFVQRISKLPLAPGVPYHSIMGDRGKGGSRGRNPPVSSDGVVPFWSSHLKGAQSELVVPSYHHVHHHRQAIAEVQRILREHAGVLAPGI